MTTTTIDTNSKNAISKGGNNNNSVGVGGGGEVEIILPPPSEKNPIPSLSAALRVDNYEQVIQLLSSSSSSSVSIVSSLLDRPPNDQTIKTSNKIVVNDTANRQQPQNQFLMFGSHSLRTLILRHVLTDPQQQSMPTTINTTAAAAANSKQPSTITPTTFPNLPRHLNIVGTGILEQPSHTSSTGTGTATPTTTTTPDVGSTTTSDTMIIPNNTEIITYFLRPTDLLQTRRVCDFIIQHDRNKKYQTTAGTGTAVSQVQQQHHRIVYMPQVPTMVHKLLSNAGLMGANNNTTTHSVTVHSLSLDLFPIENDVLSMEFPDTFRELHIEGTPSTMITYVARSLCKLQDIVGTIPRIQSYGVASEQVVRKTLDITVDEYYAQPSSSSSHHEEGAIMSTAPSETVAALIIFDRKIDMVTPLVTPLTYEGLLDDVVGIENGYINVNHDIVNPPDENLEIDKNKADETTVGLPQKSKKLIVTLAMNENDTMFSEIRDQHVEQFGTYLQQQAKSMQATQNDFKATGKQKELSELHQFVKQLPHMKQKFQYLATHIHLAELIKSTTERALFRERWQMERTILEGDICYDELDDLVAMSYPLYRFVRLFCLQSICKNGINSSRYDSIRKDFVQTYGYEFLALLVNLEKAGLLRRKEAFLGLDKASAFSKVKDLLVLINAEVDTIEPDDISYVSSGYAPLTVRLLQSAVTGWKNGRDDILREIPGRFIDIVQQLSPPEDLAATMQRPINMGGTYGSLAPPTNTTVTRTSRTKPVLIVVYLGGVTYMELTALRFLSKRPNFPYHIICCTTSILNGNTFLQSLA